MDDPVYSYCHRYSTQRRLIATLVIDERRKKPAK
jgi:hypothetical protein